MSHEYRLDANFLHPQWKENILNSKINILNLLQNNYT